MSKRRHKYGAIATVADGVRFASKAEARRYQELKMLERAGAIVQLELQPEFPLYAACELPIVPERDPLKLGIYRGDFQYVDARNGEVILEDVKGHPTPLYKWKRKHVLAQYGIQITEVK
jgi:hypothetical protein